MSPAAAVATSRRAAAAQRRTGRRRRPPVVVLAVLAVLLLAAGGLLATALRPVERVTASVSAAQAGDPLVVLSPALLASRGGPVQVSASGGGPVLLARGTAGDVAAWVEGAASSTATEQDDDGQVRVAHTDGDAQVPDPSGSDLWAVQVRGEGSARLVVEEPAASGPGAEAVLVASDGTAPAPDRVELSWSRDPVPVAAWSLLGAGAACALLAVTAAVPGLRGGLRGGLRRRRAEQGPA